jgi:pyruvate formate lyase activating enzyme
MMGTYQIVHDKYIECIVCPHNCKIQSGKKGICGVRKNTGNNIELLTHGVISGYALDPVEKKPLYHFYPGHKILSVGSFGCNMRCDFCQNYHISQTEEITTDSKITTGKILNDISSASKNIGLAFTYNEPVIWFEYILEVAAAVKKKGFMTVLVTNGFVNIAPLLDLIELTDAFNVDLKAFNNEFYRKLTGASLQPVKDALTEISKAGRHLEITTLLIPGQNDDLSEMESQVKWIASELGEETPFHLSRYFPMYKRNDPPTSHNSLLSHYEIASKFLKYVYLGNTMSETGQDTKCPECGEIITTRAGYDILNAGTIDGKCIKCGKEIYKYFTFSSLQ